MFSRGKIQNEYSRLLKQIDELPQADREIDRNLQRKLREIVIALNGIDEKLQARLEYSDKEYLNELQKQLNRQRLALTEIEIKFPTLWNWHKTHSSGFFENFKKALIDTNKFGEMLERTLKEHKKRSE